MWDTAAALNLTAEPGLQSLEQQLAARPEPLRAVRRLQGLLDALLAYTAAIPFWGNPAVSLEALAELVDLYDWYRCARPFLPCALAAPPPGPGLPAPAPGLLGWRGRVSSSHSGGSLGGPLSWKHRSLGLAVSLSRSCQPWVWMPGLPSTRPPPAAQRPAAPAHTSVPRRWLGYLGLLLLDVAICLLALVGLIRSSKGILVG